MWILILTLFASNSGAAIATIPNFETQQHCEIAKQKWLSSQINRSDSKWRKNAFKAVCVEVPNSATEFFYDSLGG